MPSGQGPTYLAISAVWAYWLGVLVMAVRARIKGAVSAGLVPKQTIEQIMWIVWVPVITGWILIPWLSITQDAAAWQLPPSRVGTLPLAWGALACRTHHARLLWSDDILLALDGSQLAGRRYHRRENRIDNRRPVQPRETPDLRHQHTDDYLYPGCGTCMAAPGYGSAPRHPYEHQGPQRGALDVGVARPGLR